MLFYGVDPNVDKVAISIDGTVTINEEERETARRFTEHLAHDNVEFFTGACGSSNLTTAAIGTTGTCLLYTSPSPRDWTISRMPSSA